MMSTARVSILIALITLIGGIWQAMAANITVNTAETAQRNLGAGGGTLTITTNGSIDVTGNNVHAIDATGIWSITNNNALSTDGASGNVINSNNAVLTIANSSTGTMQAASSHAVFAADSDLNITNTGSIRSTGAEAIKAETFGNNDLTLNNEAGSTLESTSNTALYTVDMRVNLTNRGTITGNNGPAINFTDQFNTEADSISNYGTIQTTDTVNYSCIATGDGNDQLNLYTDSSISGGNIDMGGDNDTATLDGAGTLNVLLQNAETLNKTGAGIWTLNTPTYPVVAGQDGLYLKGAGSTVTISGGELNLLLPNLEADALNIQAGTTFSCNTLNFDAPAGSGATPNINCSGTLSPGASGNAIATIDIDGDISFNNGSQFTADIHGDGSNDSVHASSATSNIDISRTNTTLEVRYAGGLHRNGQRFAVLTSANANARTDNAGSGEFTELVYPERDTMSLHLEYTTDGAVVVVDRMEYNTFTSDPNAKAGGDALAAAIPEAEGDLADVLGQLDSQPGTEVGAFFEQSVSRLPANQMQTAQSGASATGQALSGRTERVLTAMRSPRKDGPSGPAGPQSEQGLLRRIRPGWQVSADWFRSWRVGGNREHTSLLPYNSTNQGGVLEIDRAFDRGFVLGLSLSSANGRVTQDNNLAEGSQESLQTTIYGGGIWKGLSYTLSAGHSWLWFYDTRKIRAAGLNRTARARHNGHAWHLRTDLGKGFNLGSSRLTPILSLNYSRLKMDEYNEEGAGSLNLAVKQAEEDLFSHTLKFRIERPVTLGHLNLHPRLELGWKHDYSDAITTKSTYAGAPAHAFRTTLPTENKNAFILHFGTTIQMTNDLALYGSYDLESGLDSRTQSVTAGLRWQF